MKGNRWAYLFIAPFFIIFAVFGLFPPLYGFFISFFKWDLLTPMDFVGLSNYVKILSDNLFWLSVLNVILFTIAEAIPEITISLVIAYLLDTYIREMAERLPGGFLFADRDFIGGGFARFWGSLRFKLWDRQCGYTPGKPAARAVADRANPDEGGADHLAPLALAGLEYGDLPGRLAVHLA